MQRILSKREKLILRLLAGILILGIACNFIEPLLTKYQNLNLEIKTAEAKLKKYLWLLSSKDKLENKYKELNVSGKAAKDEGDTLVGLLSEIEALAKTSNIRIVDIRPQSQKGKGQEKQIDLRAEGTMEDYLKFIYKIESSLLLLNIKRFQLSVKSNSELLDGSFSISQASLIE
jgi:cell division protein FtsB